jgi:hypothetical protein
MNNSHFHYQQTLASGKARDDSNDISIAIHHDTSQSSSAADEAFKADTSAVPNESKQSFETASLLGKGLDTPTAVSSTSKVSDISA